MEIKELTELKITRLEELINKLEEIFLYQEDILEYDQNNQAKSNILLEEFAELSNAFAKTFKKEKEDNKKNLVIIDTTTGAKEELIDEESMTERIKKVLRTNNIYSCLKSLAISNKCAHSFEDEIKSRQSNFKLYYESIFSKTLNINTITFGDPIESIYPEIQCSNIYNVDKINSSDIKFIYDSITSKKEVKRSIKQRVLQLLNINFNMRDEQEINKKFEELKNHKDELINSFLIKTYEEGTRLYNLQNNMFAVKDKYIAMIGQLLKDGTYPNIKYELIKTPDAEPGFEYMFVIDDKSLSYYVEVHIPDFISESLMKEFGIVETPVRTTLEGGAKAVYRRDFKEVKRIFSALSSGEIPTPKGENKAKIITRGYTPPIQSELAEQEKVDSTQEQEEYQFMTLKISPQPALIANYLSDNEKYKDRLKKISIMKLNENYPAEVTDKIVNREYFRVFLSLDNVEQDDFIKYALNTMKESDIFERTLYNEIIKSDLTKKELAQIIICKDSLKKDFFNKKYSIIDELIQQRKVKEIESTIEGYFEENIFEEKENGSKHKR